MRPNRIIVGEARAGDCLDLLLVLNAGLPGVCTIHANSAREVLVKMCTLPLLAGENIGILSAFPGFEHRTARGLRKSVVPRGPTSARGSMRGTSHVPSGSSHPS
jgi:hypothetical protein